ncbi:hypothetical protein BH20ACT24_BH20ACT24_09400 [soil metagenome]
MLMTCFDEADQSEAVCGHLLEHRELGTELKRQAVLFRAAHHSDHLEIELGRRNLPYVKYGGMKFLEAAHVKDLVCLLRVLENPLDEVAWFRILQLVDGVGPATARRMMSKIGVLAGGGESPLLNLLDLPFEVPAAGREDFEELRSALAECGARGEDPPASAQIQRLRRFCDRVFPRRYPAVRSRLHDLEQLELIAGGYAARGRFVADLTIDPPNGTCDLAGPPLLDEDFVVFSTIHSAKDSEWDVVHVIHAADGMIPSDMATGDIDQVEEERRLFYVALTRARDALYVYVPLRYSRRNRGLEDRHSYSQTTRFLPGPVRSLFDERSTYVDREPATVGASFGRVEGVDEFLRSLWE